MTDNLCTPARRRSTVILILALAAMVMVTASCSPEKSGWAAAEKSPSGAAYRAYLEKFPGGAHEAEARRKLEAFEFKDAAAAGTTEAYRSFLEKHAEGEFAAKAREAVEALDWKSAEGEFSLAAWQKYLESYPQGAHAADARARIDAIRNARPEGTRDVSTVKIVARVEFNEEVKDVTIDFAGVLKDLFAYFGLKAAEGDAPAEATLTVVSDASAQGASYSQFGFGGGTFYYTGASVRGTATLAVKGKRTAAVDFDGEVPVPGTITGGGPTEPSGAPFDGALWSGFPRQAAVLLGRGFGYAPFIGVLSTPAERISGAAVFALKMGGPAVRPLLISALAAGNDRVRIGAAEGLRGHKSPEAIDALAACFEREGDEEATLRQTAAQSLAVFGAASLPRLETAATDSRWFVREAAARALGGIRAAKTLALLTTMLDDSASPVANAAIDALGELRTRQAVNVLIDRMAGANAEKRGLILTAIDLSTESASTGDEPEAPSPDFEWDAALAGRLAATARFIKDDSGSPDRLVEMLVRIGGPGMPGVPGLVQALKSADAPVRKTAAVALGRIAYSTALRPLIAATSDADAGVRLEAVRAVAALGDAGGTETLARLLQDADPEIRTAAIQGLKSISSNPDNAAARKFVAAEGPIRVLVEAMAVSGPEKISMRDDAAAILGWIGKPATPALVAAARSSNSFARQGAITALGLTKDEAAVGALVELGADPAVKADNALMMKLYEALGSSGLRKALAPLVEAVKSEGPGERRRAATQALQALGDIRAVDTLVEILGDGKADDAGMIREAIQTLTEYSPDEESGPFDWKAWWRANRKNYNLKKP